MAEVQFEDRRRFEQWLQARLVLVTLAAIIASYLAERLGAPLTLVRIFDITSYLAGGLFGARSAVRGLIRRRIDVDILMILAALGAAYIDQWREGAILLFLFSLSNVLQNYAIGRSRSAIRGLLNLYPEEARVKRAGGTETVRLNEIAVGDLVLIEPGERIPVDGSVMAGHSSVDQSPITGESIPVDKGPGEDVFTGTLNLQGILDVEVRKLAEETTLARIIALVEEAQEKKAPTERFLMRFEQVYAAGILIGIALFILLPPLLGLVQNFSGHFYTAMVLMTVASPCALVISVPASFVAAIASAARGGVLMKGGKALEDLAAIRMVAFDKTGTLTRGRPQVTEVIACCEPCDDELLAVAAAVEARSEHPLAKAIVEAATVRGLLNGGVVEGFEALPGRGVLSQVDGRHVRLGSLGFLEDGHPLPERLRAARQDLEHRGRTLVGVVRDLQCESCGGCPEGKDGYNWMGFVALADEVRPESAETIRRLKADGVEVAMLTGDLPQVAQNVARQVGIDRVHAGLMPEEKVDLIRQLQQLGPIAMVGDGVNDAPALATADVGVAMGAAGTDVALETADVVLMGDRIEHLRDALQLSRKARQVVWQNIIFSLAVILVLMVSVFAIDLSLPLGVLGHEGSTVVVVLNGLITLLLIPEWRRRSQASA